MKVPPLAPRPRTKAVAPLVFSFLFLLSFISKAQSSGPGHALSFTGGSNSYVAIQHDSRLNPYPFTATAWVKTVQTSGVAGLVNKYISAALNGWQLYLLNGQLRAWYFGDHNNYVWDGGDGLNAGLVADGSWHHIAFTVDATGGKLYVDGLLRASRAWTGTPRGAGAHQEFRLGDYPGGGPRFFSGTMDEITLWSTNLSQAQIQGNMKQSLSGTNAGLELYLRLDDGPGKIVYDSAGHGHDGVLFNSLAWVTSSAPIGVTNADITVQPLSRVIEAGTLVTFSVKAALEPATYQWRFNGREIPGATNPDYSLPNVMSSDAGVYDAAVNGALMSLPAELKVATLPEILVQPVGEIANEGAAATFETQTIGGRPLTHLWYHDGGLVSLNSGNNLSLNPLKLADAGSYLLVVTNAYGSATSSVAMLKVYSGPITSNLVAHLTFDSQLTDSSGRHNDGKYLHNGSNGGAVPIFTTGLIGPCSQLTTLGDGSKFDYVTLDYPPDLQLGSNDFTVSFWVNYSNQGGDLPFVCNKDWHLSHNPGWSVSAQSPGTFRVNFTGLNEGMDMFSTALTPLLRDGAWHNILVSVLRAPPPQSAFVYVFADGVLVNKTPMSLAGTIDTLGLPFTYASPQSTVQTNWAINIGQDGTGVYYDGGSYNIAQKIDDLGIWRRALTPDEARSLYVSGLEARDLTQTPEYSTLKTSFSSGSLKLSWAASPLVRLQTSASLNPTGWVDVPGTLGQNSATIQTTNSTSFFRLTR